MRPNFLHIGHRGAAAYATENTLSSIQTALACGVDMVELDVRRSRDHHLVLAHGPYLHGQDHKVKVGRHSLDQLRHVCLPGGETVATLEEALRFIQGKALVNIDLKERGIEEDAVRLVEQLGMQHQVMFSGFDATTLRRVKHLNASLFVTLSYPSTFLIDLYQHRYLQPMIKLLERRALLRPSEMLVRHLIPWRVKRLTLERGIDAMIIRAPFLSPKLVDIVHQKELKLYTWPADQPSEVEKLRQWGVDGVESNKPDIIHQTKPGPVASRA